MPNRVMQEIIQDRKSCRNIFEVLEFVCVDYDVYVKTRLINLATKRCTYRNGFGLKKLSVASGISRISRIGQSTFEVVQEIYSQKCVVTVEMTSGACSRCEMTKFCAHVSAVGCLYPESMVSERAFV